MSSKKKSGNGSKTPHNGGGNSAPKTIPFIKDDVARLFGDLTTPETPVKFATPSRASAGSIENSIHPPAAQWTWQNEAERQQQTVKDTDLGKYGYQADINTLFKLTSTTPAPVWLAVHDFSKATWMWRNQTERSNQTVLPADIGKVGYQEDTNTFYQLTNVQPPVWSSVPDPTRISTPFELSTGASDADSYHDFFRLQIAFEDVWAELLDTRISQAGEQLYATYDALADQSNLAYDDSGKTDRQKGQFPDAPTGDIAGVDQLKAFINELKLFLGLPADLPGPSASVSGTLQQLKDALIQTLNGCNMLLTELNRAGTSKPDLTHGFWDGNKWLAATGSTPDDPNAPADMGNFPAGTKRQDVFNAVLSTLGFTVPQPGTATPAPDLPFPDIYTLLSELDAMLKERYRFDVFAPASINYGLLLNYRQKWEPQSYQVGNLVSTIPLAPQEVRKYTTKTVIKKTRSAKEIDNGLRDTKDESSETARTDAEIVDRARNQTNFQTNASGSYGDGQLYKVEAGMQLHNDQGVESAQTKRDFHEAVLKSAQEYRNEHRLEVDSEEVREDETTTTQELRNPNDELTVTYLFYELQRRYLVDESLYRATPVILVANEVPAPHEVDSAWILRHDWIIRRTILDTSFLPALEYLAANYTGEEVTLRTLEMAVYHQKGIVDRIAQQIQAANDSLNAATAGLMAAQGQQVTETQIGEVFGLVHSFLDPIGIAAAQKFDDGNSDRARVDFAKDIVNRAQAKVNQLLSDMKAESTALQVAIDKYTAAATRHFGMLAEIDRLRLHVKDNIIYYMQAVWTYEPPDQRYFRLYNLEVPVFAHNTQVIAQKATRVRDVSVAGPGVTKIVSLPPPTLEEKTKKLHQVANLDNLLGFKGNYMIFPLVDFDNYMTWYLIHKYIYFDKFAGVIAQDPDEGAALTLGSLQTAMEQIHAKDPASFAQYESQFEEVMLRLLAENSTQMVIVPSKSLYIEALPGTHPLLEDFKLIHRALDVKKVQAEVRKAELENLRLAGRLENAEYGDPDIDKVVVVGNRNPVTVDAGQ